MLKVGSLLTAPTVTVGHVLTAPTDTVGLTAPTDSVHMHRFLYRAFAQLRIGEAL